MPLRMRLTAAIPQQAREASSGSRSSCWPATELTALDSLGPCRGERASMYGLGSIHSPGVERGGSKRIAAAVSRPVSIRSRKGTHLAKGDLGYWDPVTLFASSWNCAAPKAMLTLLRGSYQGQLPGAALPHTYPSACCRRIAWLDASTAAEVCPRLTLRRAALVTEVAYSNWTIGQVMRHPKFVGLPEDKPAR
jgi:hypothetical protein